LEGPPSLFDDDLDEPLERRRGESPALPVERLVHMTTGDQLDELAARKRIGDERRRM
jgi:hypothetical protein